MSDYIANMTPSGFILDPTLGRRDFIQLFGVGALGFVTGGVSLLQEQQAEANPLYAFLGGLALGTAALKFITAFVDFDTALTENRSAKRCDGPKHPYVYSPTILSTDKARAMVTGRGHTPCRKHDSGNFTCLIISQGLVVVSHRGGYIVPTLWGDELIVINHYKNSGSLTYTGLPLKPVMVNPKRRHAYQKFEEGYMEASLTSNGRGIYFPEEVEFIPS